MDVTEKKMAKEKADDAIRALWVAYRKLSDHQQPDEWSDDDMDLWGHVTRHRAVQDRLSNTN